MLRSVFESVICEEQGTSPAVKEDSSEYVPVAYDYDEAKREFRARPPEKPSRVDPRKQKKMGGEQTFYRRPGKHDSIDSRWHAYGERGPNYVVHEVTEVVAVEI